MPFFAAVFVYFYCFWCEGGCYFLLFWGRLLTPHSLSSQDSPAEIVRLRELRTSVKVQQKSLWVCRFIEDKQRYYYICRTENLFLVERPVDFDGVDHKAVAEEEALGERKRLLHSRGDRELEAVREHSERIEALQCNALEASSEVATLARELHQLRSEETRLAKAKLHWSALLATTQKNIVLEHTTRSEEELADEEEGNERRSSAELYATTERQLLETPVSTTQAFFKQKEEANTSLRDQVAKLKSESQHLQDKLDHVATTVDNMRRQNSNLQAVITTGRARCIASQEKEAVLIHSIKAQQENKSITQHKVTRARQSESREAHRARKGELKEGELRREIDRLQDLIRRKHTEALDETTDGRGHPRADTTLEQETAEKQRLISDVAKSCSVGVETMDAVLQTRNECVQALKSLEILYTENFRLISSAVVLPSRIVGVFAANSEKLRQGLLKISAERQYLLQERAQCDAHECLDVSELLRSAASGESMQRKRQDLTIRITALRTTEREVSRRLFLLNTKSDVCSMEEEYLLKLQQTRVQDRVAHMDAARQSIEYADRLLQGIARLPAEWPLSTAIPDGPHALSLAVRCSNGVLSETRRNLAATEAFVLRSKERKKIQRSREKQENRRIIRWLGGGVQKVQHGTVRIGTEEVGRFAVANADLEKEMDDERHHITKLDRRRLPARISRAGDVQLPKKFEKAVTHNSVSYAVEAATAWMQYSRDLSS